MVLICVAMEVLLQLLSWLCMFFMSKAVSHDTAASLFSVWNSCSICWLIVYFSIVTLLIVTVKEIHVMHSCTSRPCGKSEYSTLEGTSLCSSACQGIYFCGKNLNFFSVKKNLNLNEISIWPKQCCTITNFLNQHFSSLLLWSSTACHLIWAWNSCCLISYACILLKTGEKILCSTMQAIWNNGVSECSSAVVTIISTPHATKNRILQSWQKSLSRRDNDYELV